MAKELTRRWRTHGFAGGFALSFGSGARGGLAGASRWLALSALALFARPSHAQYSTSTDVTASATVVRVLAVTSATELSFGTFAPGNNPGSLTVAPTGGRSATGGVQLIAAQVGSHATVNLAGTPGTSYGVSIPATIRLTAAKGTASMTLGNFTSTLTNAQGQLNASGSGSFGIGGTLSVDANQAAGAYSGKFTVTMNYF